MNRSSQSILLVLVSSPLLLAGCSKDDDRNGYGDGGYSGSGGAIGRAAATSSRTSGSAVSPASPRGGFGGFGRGFSFGG